MASFIYKELSDKVLGAAFTVHNVLGPGLLESAYEGAICVELKHLGLSAERQPFFRSRIVASTSAPMSLTWLLRAPSSWS